MRPPSPHRLATLFVLVSAIVAVAVGEVQLPPSIDAAVAASEARRIEVIERLSASTVAIFESTATNGGSGVIISDEGLVVTNFHVTAPCGPRMHVGTNDGVVHEAVLLGIDPTGDIALVQLLGEGPFPAADIGDSDTVRVGDTAIVAGNPFLLAEDFTPSVTVGIVSGVGRYQPPAGSLLEYADCLQTDAAINPGNSGGPLFDGEGRLIGINGRGSFEKRGRVNVGVGYAVSINQVRRFVSHLRAGRLVDHASLGATVVTRRGPMALVSAIERASDAYRRGLRPGDEMVSVDGRDTPTANAFLNAIGVLPAGWRAEVEFRRDGRLLQREIRLGSLHGPGRLLEAISDEQSPDDADPPDAKTIELDASLYEEREGYANYAALRAETQRLLRLCRQDGLGAEPVERSYEEGADGRVTIRLTPDAAEWRSRKGEFRCDPTRDLATQSAPPAAPGLLGGLWVWNRLATGEEGLIDRVEAFGQLPWIAGESPHDVLVALHRGLRVEVYLEADSGTPLGFEASRDAAEDAVRVEFATDGAQAEGLALPRAMEISVGSRPFADLRDASQGEPTRRAGR